jgi:hypothetical protein
MSDLPEVSADAIDSIFSLLSEMEVGLDSDPLQFGPKRLNGKVAKARKMLTECEGVFLRVSQWLQKYRHAHRTLEVEFDIEKKHLFANDPEVRAGRNVADRDALAIMKMRDQYRLLSQTAQTQSDLEAMLTVIKAKRSDLRDVQSRIRDQIKLCQEEIGLGSRWWSKPPPGTLAPDLDTAPNVDKQTLKDLHEMFTGTGVAEPDLAAVAEISLAPEAPAPEAPAPEAPAPEAPAPEALSEDESATDADSDEFLDAISTPESGPDLRSLEDILGDLGI